MKQAKRSMKRFMHWLGRGDVEKALRDAPFGWTSGYANGVFGFTVSDGEYAGRTGEASTLFGAVIAATSRKAPFTNSEPAGALSQTEGRET